MTDNMPGNMPAKVDIARLRELRALAGGASGTLKEREAALHEIRRALPAVLDELERLRAQVP